MSNSGSLTLAIFTEVFCGKTCVLLSIKTLPFKLSSYNNPSSPIKAPAFITSILGIETLWLESTTFSNAFSFITLRFGKFISSNPEFLKAFTPTSSSNGIWTLLNSLQSSNALSFIILAFGNITSVTVEFLKAFVPTVSTDGISIVPKL